MVISPVPPYPLCEKCGLFHDESALCYDVYQTSTLDLQNGLVFGYMPERIRASRERNLEIMRNRRLATKQAFLECAAVGERKWQVWNTLLNSLGERKDSSR